jgi:hypothetical protein
MKTVFQSFLDEWDYKTFSYSGRGMFGAKCLAITVKDVFAAMQELQYLAGEQGITLPKLVRSEVFDHEFVVFWPTEIYN